MQSTLDNDEVIDVIYVWYYYLCLKSYDVNY